MKIYKINQLNPEEQLIQLAARVLSEGSVILHPTETVYGLAGIYNNSKVIRKINDLKKRPEDQPFSIMVNALEDMFRISGNISLPWLKNFLTRFLPGPLTVLLPRKKNLDPMFWNQFPDIGFRYPGHPISLDLVKSAGTPLITTSANISGEPSPSQMKEIPDQLLKQIPLILDGGSTEQGQPSSIIRINTETRIIEFIREGCIPIIELENAFKECISIDNSG